MLKEGSSRGLSRAGTFFLIIFIVLLIAAFIFVKEVILKGSEERALGKYTLNLEISQVQIIENNSLLVMVKRNAGTGGFVGINFIIDDGRNKEIIKTNISLQELESRVFLLNLVKINVSRAKSISIAPVFRLESKKESSGDIKDEYIFGLSDSENSNCIAYCPSEFQCGDDGCGGICAGGCTQEGYFCLDHKCIANLETKCSQTEIIITEVVNLTPENFSVTLFREGSSEEIGGVKLIFTDEFESSSFVSNVEENMALFENVTKYIVISESYLANPKKVRIMVYFIDESGNQEFCESLSSFSF